MLLYQLSCVLAGCSLAAIAQPGIPEEFLDAWLALLHYRESRGQWVSEIDEASFFLDSTGGRNPEAEWAADSAAFLRPAEATRRDADARCRFPARFALMKRAFGWTDAHVPQVECSDLAAYEATLRGKMVSVVFVSYYLGNPASAFGHVMLSFADGPEAALAGYSVSFEARTTGLSTLSYIRQGLFGGLSAAYHVTPLYERAGRYERQELRDLWLFPLQMSEGEVGQLARHLWELKDLTFAYGFFGDNCAKKILAAVHAVAPAYGLLPYSPAAVLPSEVVRRLVTKVGLRGPPLRRPSLLEQYERQVSALSSQERAQLQQTVVTQTVRPGASTAVLSAALTWSEIRTPSRAFRRESEVSDHPDAVWRRHLWLSISASGDTTQTAQTATASTTQLSLLASHRPASITIRSGYRAGVGSVQGVGVRWLLHDVLDPDVGYPPRASVSVGQVEVNVDATGRINVDEVTALRVEQLGPASTLRPGVAWRMELGARRLQMSTASPLHVGLELDVGAGMGVTRPNASVFMYTLAGLRPGVISARNGQIFALEGILTGGLVMQLPGGIRTLATIDQVASLGSSPERGSSIGVVVRKQLARDWEVETRFRHAPAFRELSAGIVAFF